MPFNAEQNQKDNQNQDPNQQADKTTQTGVNLGGSGDTGSAGAMGSGRVASFSSGTQQSQSGSGRYTNLQKYIGANQGATDRLYQGINQRINQTTDPQKQQAQTEADKVKQGISQGNESINRGTGYYNQMQDKNFNAQDFASDQNRLDDYSKFRTGSAVDTDALNNQNNTAQTATMQAQDLYNNRLNQVGNEGGRFDLLKETFGGRNAYRPTYSSGQQRLDQLFLQSGAGNKVGQLQNDLRGNINNLGQNLSNLQGLTVDQINAIQNQQNGLSDNIQNKANSLETGYIGDLQGQVAGVNTNRDAERTRYNNFVRQLLDTGQGKETSQMLDQDIFNEALLRQGEQTFNYLKNPTLTTEQFQNIDTRNAADYHDIANQQNVDYYDALSKLAGINNSKLSSVGQLIDPTTGQLNRAATIKTGDGSLRQGIDNAQLDFLKNALGTTVSGTGKDSGSSGWAGGGSDAEVTLQQNLAKYLADNGLTSADVLTAYNPLNSTQNQVHDAANKYSMASQASLNTGKAFDMLAPGSSAFTGHNLINSTVDAVNNLTGAGSGSSAAATSRAQMNLMDNLNAILAQSGFNNYLTSSGIKNTDDIASKFTGADKGALDIDRSTQGRNGIDPTIYMNNAGYGTPEYAEQAKSKQAYNAGLLNMGMTADQFNNLSATDNQRYQTLSNQLGTGDLRNAYAQAQQYQQRLNQAQQVANRYQTEAQQQYNAGMSGVDAAKQSALAEMRARLGISDFNVASAVPNDKVSVNDLAGDTLTKDQVIARRLAGK